MGVWDTLRTYDRTIGGDWKDQGITDGRYVVPSTTAGRARFNQTTSAPTAPITTNLTPTVPTPYTDQFLRPQVTTPSAQVPSTVPAAARPAAAREVARRVATTPAPRPVPISQPTISYGGSTTYPTEGEALMTELLAANAQPQAPVNPIADNGFVGPELGANGITVMDTNGVRQVAIPQGATGRPMDEGFVGRYAAAGKNGQIVLANGGATPNVVYKDPNAIPADLFKGVPGVQGDNLRRSAAIAGLNNYGSPGEKLSDIIAINSTLGKDYHAVRQGDYYGAQAEVAPIEAQAKLTGADAQMVGAQAERDSVGAKYITAQAAMKQATTRENGGAGTGKTADERKTERWQNQYKTNLAAVNSDIANMKLSFEQKSAKATQVTDQQLGVGSQPASGNIAPVGTRVPKKGGGFYTSDGKGGWY